MGHSCRAPRILVTETCYEFIVGSAPAEDIRFAAWSAFLSEALGGRDRECSDRPRGAPVHPACGADRTAARKDSRRRRGPKPIANAPPPERPRLPLRIPPNHFAPYSGAFLLPKESCGTEVLERSRARNSYR